MYAHNRRISYCASCQTDGLSDRSVSQPYTCSQFADPISVVYGNDETKSAKCSAGEVVLFVDTISFSTVVTIF